ncbi:MAG TPA: MoaD/ThiS family protein [Anaerolinea sp.]|nr:MoaD/ThiS family protein [Anaerolinea sp.]
MTISVEFTGAARAVVGQKTIQVKLDDHTTYRDVVRRLAATYPALIGLLIDTDGETFLSGNMFVINGDLSTPAMVLDEHPHPGDHLILMSLVTGG